MRYTPDPAHRHRPFTDKLTDQFDRLFANAARAEVEAAWGVHQQAITAHCDRPGTTSGPTEAISGRLQRPHGSTLEFTNPTRDIARSLAEDARSLVGGLNVDPLVRVRRDRRSDGGLVISRCAVRLEGSTRQTVWGAATGSQQIHVRAAGSGAAADLAARGA